MTHADKFSKQWLLCQSADNFCVFAMKERLQVMSWSETGHEYPTCHLLKWRSKERGRWVEAESGKQETPVQANQAQLGRSRLFSDKAQGTPVITCSVDIWGSVLTCNQHCVKSQVLYHSRKSLLPWHGAGFLFFPYLVIYSIYFQSKKGIGKRQVREATHSTLAPKSTLKWISLFNWREFQNTDNTHNQRGRKTFWNQIGSKEFCHDLPLALGKEMLR